MKMEVLRKYCLVGLLPVFMSMSARNNEIESQPKDQPMVNQQYEKQMNQLDSEVIRLDKNWDTQSTTIRLSQDTNSKVNIYLDQLYSNINSTRVQHLPEWQTIFDVLTLPDDQLDSNMTLSTEPNRQNNLLVQRDKIKAQEILLAKNAEEIASLTKTNAEQNDRLALQEKNLITLQDEMKILKALVDSQSAAVNTRIDNYESRIEALSGLVETLKAAFGNLERELGTRVARAEGLFDGIKRTLEAFPMQDMYSMAKTAVDRLKVLEPLVNDANRNVGIVGTQITSVSAKQDSLALDFSALNTTMAALDAKVSPLVTRIDVLKTSLDGLQTVVGDGTSGGLADATLTANTAILALKDLSAELVKLGKQVCELRNDPNQTCQ